MSKVLLLNGSPRVNGITKLALMELSKSLNRKILILKLLKLEVLIYKGVRRVELFKIGEMRN